MTEVFIGMTEEEAKQYSEEIGMQVDPFQFIIGDEEDLPKE